MGRAHDPFAAALIAAPHRSTHASSWPAIAAVAAAGLAVALLPVSGSLAIGIVGYLAAALLAPAFVVAYRVIDRQAQQSIRYVRRQLPRRLAAIAIVVGLLAGTTHAWMIATELAKR
jgi:hypothetical protein